MEARAGGSRATLIGLLVLAVTAMLALAGSAEAAKKKGKKKKGGNVATVQKIVNAQVPDRAPGPGTVSSFLRTELPVGKQFKGREVKKVEVTFQTTGDSANSAEDLDFVVTAPDGTTMGLYWENAFGGQSIGPLTLVPNSPVRVCNSPTPPCSWPFSTLNRPFAGTAGEPFLRIFNGVGMRGTWVFTVVDTSTNATSVLNLVRLKITAAKKQ